MRIILFLKLEKSSVQEDSFQVNAAELTDALQKWKFYLLNLLIKYF